MKCTVHMIFNKPPSLTINVDADSIAHANEVGIQEARRAGMDFPRKIIVTWT